MKLVFLGTPDFACKPLEAILNSNHEILAVVTQPDKPVGRKGIITPCAVKVLAQNSNLVSDSLHYYLEQEKDNITTNTKNKYLLSVCIECWIIKFQLKYHPLLSFQICVHF